GPLVENAFMHDMEEREEGGLAYIRSFKTTDNIIVEVSDDGVEISLSPVDEIISLNVNENEHVGHSKGIGLTNVIRRLQLFFTVDDIIEIDSKLNQGTIVRLLLPKN